MFIKLHSMNNKEIRINMNLIESYGVISKEVFDCKEEDVGYTYLIPINLPMDEEPYIVKETPEEIDELLIAWEYR